MLIAVTLAIFVTMILAIIRGIIGPSLYDRILAVNMFGTKTVLLIAVLGFVMGRPEFLDIAIVYALINFISVIGVLKYSDSNQFKHVSLANDAAANDSVTNSSVTNNSLKKEP